MFETSGFLSNLHQKLCNPSVPSHKKIKHIWIVDYGGGEGD